MGRENTSHDRNREHPNPKQQRTPDWVLALVQLPKIDQVNVQRVGSLTRTLQSGKRKVNVQDPRKQSCALSVSKLYIAGRSTKQ